MASLALAFYNAVMLVLMTGLPGTGKSTVAAAVARALPAALLSADPIERALIQSGIEVDDGKAAYEVMKGLARQHLATGLSVVIDGVNPFEWLRREYIAIAEEHHELGLVIHTVCAAEAVHRLRVEERHAAGVKEIDWDGGREANGVLRAGPR